MADINKTIRYTVEFDTATGKRQIKQALSEATSESKPSGGGDGTTPTSPEKVALTSDSVKESAKSIGEMLKSNLGSILGATIPQLLRGNIGGALESGAGAAGGALAQGGALGAVAGGALAVAAGFATLVKSVFSFGESLAGLNGMLFTAYGRFDLVMEGLKIDMAQKLGPAISGIVDDLAAMAVELEPLAASILQPLFSILRDIMHYLVPIVGLIGAVLQPTIENLVSVFKVLYDVIKIVVDSMLWATGKVMEGVGALVEFIGKIPGIGKATGIDFKGIGEQVDIMGKALADAAGSGISDAAKDIGKEVNSVINKSDRQWKGITDAWDKVAKSFEGGANGSKGVDDAIARANALNLSLFNQLKDWSHTLNQGMQGGVRHMTLDMAHDFRKDVARFSHDLGDKRPSDSFVDKAGKGQGIPRPSPAAVHFKVSDYVEIQAQDEQQVHFELMMHMQKLQEWYTKAKDISWLNRSRAFNRLHAKLA